MQAERTDGLASLARDPDSTAAAPEASASDRDAMLAVVGRAESSLDPADTNLVAATMAMLALLDHEVIACHAELRRREHLLESIRRIAIGGTDSPVGVAATS